jgi:hypothetical protein
MPNNIYPKDNPKTLSTFAVPDQSSTKFYGDLVFFCFGFGLEDSLKADGQRLLMSHMSHLGLSGVQIVCPNPTYKTFTSFFSID